jgi:hypothetical protein
MINAEDYPLADDQNEQAQPDSHQAVKDYVAQVTKSIVAAEEHLKVPAGTISSIPSDPDFIATIKMYAVVEPILNDLIASRPPGPQSGPFSWLGPSQSDSESFRTFVTALNMDGRTGKLSLADVMGLLTKRRIDFVRALARVRHRYAHNVRNMHRPLIDIVTEEQRTNERIVQHLTGLHFAAPVAGNNELLKLFTYYWLADYLSSALQTLRPPAPPEGGWLLGTPPPSQGGCSARHRHR